MTDKASRVLVVDDEAGVREFVAKALELDGFVAFAVGSAEEALTELGKRSYDLLFTDLKLPGMNGLELLARAKERQPELEVNRSHGAGLGRCGGRGNEARCFRFRSEAGERTGRAAPPLGARARAAFASGHPRNIERDSAADPALSYGDPKMDAVIESLRKVAKTTATVLPEVSRDADAGLAFQLQRSASVDTQTDSAMRRTGKATP